MSRSSQRREAEWQFKQEMRRKHEARISRERRDDARQRNWLALLRHQDAIFCASCGARSAGPWIEPEIDVLLRPSRVDWESSANLVRCMACGGWLCAACTVYVAGVGRRCRRREGAPWSGCD